MNNTTLLQNHNVHPYFIQGVHETQVVILSLMLAACLFGNILIITAICRTKKLRTPSNILIINLAVCDLMTATSAIPFTLIIYVHHSSQSYHPYGETGCKTLWPFTTYANNCSVFTLATIAVDRYLNISSRSFKFTKRRTVFVLVLIHVFAMLIVIPYGVHLKYIVVDKVGYCYEVWFNKWYMKVYKVSLFVIQYALPLCIMVSCYLLAWLNIYNHNNAVIKMSEDYERKISSMGFIPNIQTNVVSMSPCLDVSNTTDVTRLCEQGTLPKTSNEKVRLCEQATLPKTSNNKTRLCEQGTLPKTSNNKLRLCEQGTLPKKANKKVKICEQGTLPKTSNKKLRILQRKESAKQISRRKNDCVTESFKCLLKKDTVKIQTCKYVGNRRHGCPRLMLAMQKEYAMRTSRCNSNASKREIKRFSKSPYSSQISYFRSRQSVRLLKMFTVLVLVFGCFQLPKQLHWFLQDFSDLPPMASDIFTLLTYISTFVNCWIYSGFDNRIRKAYIQTICCSTYQKKLMKHLSYTTSSPSPSLYDGRQQALFHLRKTCFNRMFTEHNTTFKNTMQLYQVNEVKEEEENIDGELASSIDEW